MNKSTYWLVVLTILTGTIFTGCTTANAPTPTTQTEVEIPSNENNEEENQVDTNVNTSINTSADTTVSTTQFKDGTYTKEGNYKRPEGTDAIKVTVTLKDDKIASVQVIGEADNAKSKIFQKLFIEGINQVVVGKSLSELGATGAVNGSSLTPNGFNVAIEAIKKEAKA